MSEDVPSSGDAAEYPMRQDVGNKNTPQERAEAAVKVLARDAWSLASMYGEGGRDTSLVAQTEADALSAIRELEAARAENCRLYREALALLAARSET